MFSVALDNGHNEEELQQLLTALPFGQDLGVGHIGQIVFMNEALSKQPVKVLVDSREGPMPLDFRPCLPEAADDSAKKSLGSVRVLNRADVYGGCALIGLLLQRGESGAGVPEPIDIA